MAEPITKILQGAVSIDLSTETIFTLPTIIGTSLPNALDNSALEEVYVSVNASGADLTLPAISLFNGAKNVKIYFTITDIEASVTIRPYSSETETNTINGFSFRTLSGIGQVAYLHIVSATNWMLLTTFVPVP